MLSTVRQIWEGNDLKPFGVAIDNKLNFDSYIASTCLKVNQKLIVLHRLAEFIF